MTAKMLVLTVDANIDYEALGMDYPDPREIDFYFDSKEVLGLYRQDEEITILLFNGGHEIPTIFDEYTYGVLSDYLKNK